MRVLADSHAVVWHLQGSSRLSAPAAEALAEAEATDGVVVSVATLVDLWYVTQTTRKVTAAHLAGLRNALLSSAAFILQPIDLPIVSLERPKRRVATALDVAEPGRMQVRTVGDLLLREAASESGLSDRLPEGDLGIGSWSHACHPRGQSGPRSIESNSSVSRDEPISKA